MGNPKNKVIGIVGGGQLGRMTILEARKMDIEVIVLTPEHPSPASDIADDYIIGSLYDENKIKELAEKCDILSYEIEHINVDVLEEIEKSGKTVNPSSKVLKVIQDKSKQKALLQKFDLPTSNWDYVNEDNLDNLVKKYGFPIVQKSCTGGYDGKGVFIIKNEDDLKHMLKGKTFFEEYIPFEKEIAMMVARNKKGEIKTYPLVDMVFDNTTNMCDITVCPSTSSLEIQIKAKLIAEKAIEALDGYGIFGVEMFVTKENEVLINEIAPRPHNSGHYTIEGTYTSQYEQYLRAIMNLPLGETAYLKPNVMINLFGESGYSGKTLVEGFEKALEIAGVNVHLYGKKETKPNRKMGHITVLDDNIDIALEKAKKAKNLIKIISEEV
jgi:5-(carboxyamino)imidazole ribonucleotide synthase